tara:strand:- start:14584 stop:16356 length:1773 start_codon:yes stop_codon:yes gene_type:complete
MATDFPQSGDDEPISLGNSRFDVFDHSYARDLKRNHPDIWGAGGNIRGNEAFEIWKRAERGVSSPAVLAWIKEREAWSARHFEDGKQFQDADLGPNLSNVAGIVAQVKWGTVGVLGESRMKAVLDQLKKRRETRADLADVEPGLFVRWRAEKGIYTGVVDEVVTSGMAEFGAESMDTDDVGPVAIITVFVEMNDDLIETDRQVGVPVVDLDLVADLGDGSEEQRQVTGNVKVALQRKLEEHNDEHGDDARKRATMSMLEKVFERGVGAYKTQPSSVRPSIPNAEAWAYARVNSFLYALANLKFRRGKHDQDLLPSGHPESSKDERMSDEKRERVNVDQFTTEDEAKARAEILGCEGTHTMDLDGQTIYMPCSTHAAYDRIVEGGASGGGSGGTGGYRAAPAEKLERRAHQEVKLESGDTADTIVGYASVFDSESRDLGDFVEYIKPGAFTRAINEHHDVRALVDHDPKMILGRTKSGTLRLTQDEHGLRTEIDIPHTTVGQDTLESIRRGDLDAMSFGFVVRDDSWEERDGKTVREIRDLDLFDVSVVSFPAYEDTTVAVRGLKRQALRRDTPKPEMLRLYLRISDGVAE